MSHWRNRLREADEALTSELRPEDAQRLRRTIIAAATPARPWPLPFALTAASLAVASAALVLAVALAAPGPQNPQNPHNPQNDPRGDAVTAPGDAGPEAPIADNGRRQLHFATPGGTRIIWVFDAEFEVKGTLP